MIKFSASAISLGKLFRFINYANKKRMLKSQWLSLETVVKSETEENYANKKRMLKSQWLSLETVVKSETEENRVQT